jgi:beta-aspartyl-peptidase (threonine type)
MTALIIHGGAGNIPDSVIKAKKSTLESTLLKTISMLKNGTPALDAVEFAVRCMEDDPVFNAGYGSCPNAEGEVEMDAIIIDGDTLNFGAVAGIRNVRNPVAVARRVLNHGRHCLLAGHGATRFAHANGFEHVSDKELIAEVDKPDVGYGTVGAVALDAQGSIASATSTGGIAKKLPGRVGDSPLIGCGAIADSAVGGVSATGEGEFLMRIMISRVVLDGLQSGRSADQASAHAIDLLGAKVRGKGGVICLGKGGDAGYAFNTPRMAFAYFNGRGEMKVSV